MQADLLDWCLLFDVSATASPHSRRGGGGGSPAVLRPVRHTPAEMAHVTLLTWKGKHRPGVCHYSSQEIQHLSQSLWKLVCAFVLHCGMWIHADRLLWDRWRAGQIHVSDRGDWVPYTPTQQAKLVHWHFELSQPHRVIIRAKDKLQLIS